MTEGFASMAQSNAASAPPGVRRCAPAASPNQILAIVCVGICLANLDLFIVNVGLPAIGRDFAASNLEDLSWILNGYAIVYAALLVFFGRLAERANSLRTAIYADRRDRCNRHRRSLTARRTTRRLRR